MTLLIVVIHNLRERCRLPDWLWRDRRFVLGAALLFLSDVGMCSADCMTLVIDDQILKVEIMRTEVERQQGLTDREALESGQGMLFIFPQVSYQSMWMKNTRIPLSVAFIDTDGDIVNIAHMVPKSDDVYYSLRAVKYVLEVNRGWFEQHGIVAGMRVTGLLQGSLVQD